ncbi:MAG: hypothetical protein AAGF60_08595 [Pseudomonadota bacterium]
MNKLVRKFGIVRRIETDDLEVWVHEGAAPSGQLVVSFSSVGPNPDVVPPVEFPRLATADGQGHALFIVDKTRSWLNAPGLLERVVAQIEAQVQATGADRVVTLGNSMGGYNAALIAGFTKVDVALGFSPQATVHPDVAGDDLRWPRYRIDIEDHRFEGLHKHLSETCTYIAIYGDRPREAPQFRRFPDAPNTHVVMLPGHGHGTAFTLKAKNLLGAAVHTAFAGDVDGLLAALGPKLGAVLRRPGQVGLRDIATKAGAMERAAREAIASGELHVD